MRRGGRTMCPRFRLAIAKPAADSTASLSRWTHQVGVTDGILGDDTPTRTAIDLSSPVVCAARPEMGELSSWQSVLPPPGGGGSVAGSADYVAVTTSPGFPPRPPEIFQEGLRLPPKKLFVRGQVNRDLLDVILANCRIPEQNWGDLQALVAGLTTGERGGHRRVRRLGAAH